MLMKYALAYFILSVLFINCAFCEENDDEDEEYQEEVEVDVTKILDFDKHDFLRFSLDMRKATRDESEYIIELVEQTPEIMEPYYVQTAIRRYEQYWVPFMEEYPKLTWLKAPKDIAFVWHTHRLNPIAYRITCETELASILNPPYFNFRHEFSPLILDIYETQSKKLWDEFVKGKEPYDYRQVKSTEMDKNYTQILHYDLTDACRRRNKGSVGLYPFAKDIMKYDYFLDKMILTYQMWTRARIILSEQSKNESFDGPTRWAPSKGIDIVWHAHQDIPEHYYKDMDNWLGDGKFFGHNDEDELTPESAKQKRRPKDFTHKLGNKTKDQIENPAEENVDKFEHTPEAKRGNMKKMHKFWIECFGDEDGLIMYRESSLSTTG